MGLPQSGLGDRTHDKLAARRVHYLCCGTRGGIWQGFRDCWDLLLYVSRHLTVGVQAFLVSILDHLSNLLNERLPLTLQDKLTLHHNLCDLLRVVSIEVKPESNHLPVVRLQLTLSHSVPTTRDTEDVELGFGELLMSRPAPHRAPLVTFGGTAFMTPSSSIVTITETRRL